MKTLKLVFAVACLTLAGCGPSENTPPNPHDSKYAVVENAAGSCVFDSATQLTWQSKTDEPGLFNAASTYSWWHPGETNGELDYRGLEDGGQCDGSLCDAWNYVQAINKTGYCGFSDWRMPTRDELFSISDLRRAANPPTINTDFFPSTQKAEYWSGNDYSFQYNAAWAWNFELGHDRVDWKKTPKFIRLVRGTPGELEPVKE